MISLDLDCWAVCLAKHERRQLVCDTVPGFIPRTMTLVLRIKGQCDTRFSYDAALRCSVAGGEWKVGVGEVG